MQLRRAREAEAAAAVRPLARRRQRVVAAWTRARAEAVGFVLERDQIDHRRERVRSVEHRAGPLDHLDVIERRHRERLEKIADESALEHLARRAAVDQEQDVSAVEPRLIAARGDDAAVREIRAREIQSGYTVQN